MMNKAGSMNRKGRRKAKAESSLAEDLSDEIDRQLADYAYRLGRRAYRAGRSIDTNPFEAPERAVDRKQWYDGFLSLRELSTMRKFGVSDE